MGIDVPDGFGTRWTQKTETCHDEIYARKWLVANLQILGESLWDCKSVTTWNESSYEIGRKYKFWKSNAKCYYRANKLYTKLKGYKQEI